MQARQLAELASWVAIQSGSVIYGSGQQPMMVATPYWTASKIRIQRWISALKMFEMDLTAYQANGTGHLNWSAMEIVYQEIILSDVLTRVWSATVTAHDRHHQTDELEGLANAIFISHLETKNRAFRLLLTSRGINEDFYDRFNTLRRRMERWCDLFLGQIPMGEQAAIYSFESSRVRDFYAERCQSMGAELATRQRTLAASFSADLNRNLIDYSANPDLNQQIASGILACFPSDRFDSNGLPKSARMLWAEKSHSDTQLLLDHLIDLEVRVSQN